MAKDFKQYTADYQTHYGFEAHMVSFRRKKVLERIASYRATRILEIGCGVDPLFLHVPAYVDYVVVEPAEEFVRIATEKQHGRSNVEILAGRFEQRAHELSGRSFDVVIASGLLHEVDDPAAFLRSIGAICEPQTIVHINVPNGASLHNLVAVKMGLIRDVFTHSALGLRMQHQTVFDSERLQRVVVEAGFTIRAAGGYFMKPFTYAQLEQMLSSGIIDERVLEGLNAVGEDHPSLSAEIFVDCVVSGRE